MTPALAAALALAGAVPGDLGIRPERFPTELTLPAVETLLSDPGSAPETTARWGQMLEEADASARAYALAEEVLTGRRPSSARVNSPPLVCAGLTAPLAASAGRLAGAVSQGEAVMRRLSEAYTATDRARLESSFGAALRHEPLAAPTVDDVALARRFDVAAVGAAAATLAAEVDAELPLLRKAAAGENSTRHRCGAVLIAGPGENIFTAAELEATSVLLVLGGRSRYESAPAAAAAGQVKLVVDLSPELRYEGKGPAAGSGVFGIGLFYAPEPGAKIVRAGDRSLGAGFFGAGGAFIAGPGSFESGHFAQGAGAFGVGVFSVSGDTTALKADYAAQGFGYTRGVGLLAARGADVSAVCGLRHADGREAKLAMLSLCQGVGDGPRAFAAGGIGLALFSGPRPQLLSSYFAQGAGYWHAFGGLYVRGEGARLRARRYAQGAGVHAGVGLLSWKGSRGASAVWGVGPAFGWDYGVGLLSLEGDGNALQADWASGSGDVNGRSLVDVRGDGNLLSVNDWAQAPFKRTAAGYAFAQVTGKGNRLRSTGLAAPLSGAFTLAAGPWGITQGQGELILDPKISSAAYVWPEADRSVDAAAETVALRAALAQAETLEPYARLRRWLAVAASSGLDGEDSFSAAARVVAWPASETGAAARALSLEAFDEAFWLRLALAAAGPGRTTAVEKEFATAVGPRRAMLADALRAGPSEPTLKAAAALLADPDWRLRRAGAGQLGAAFGSEEGEEPGRLRFLESSAALARSTFTTGSPEEAAAFKAIGVTRLGDLYGALSAGGELPVQIRLALLAAGDPFDTVKTEALRRYTAVLRAGGPAALASTLAEARAARPRALALLRRALTDLDPGVRAAAAAALGQLGAVEDAPLLGRALKEESAFVREAAALGLARLGAPAREEILRALKLKGEAKRAAILAAAQSTDEKARAAALGALEDSDERTRLWAVAALDAPQAPYREAQRAAAVPALRRLAAADPSLSVKASAARALGQIAPAVYNTPQ